MYLNEPRQLDILKQQLRFKLNSNASAFTILIAFQLFALLFSFSSSSSSHYFDETSYISINAVTSTPHITFMIAWAFFIGVRLANQSKWNEAFSFVSTRLTHHLSNLLFMLLASFLAGFMVILIGPALRLLTNLRYEEIDTLTSTITEAPLHLPLQFITVVCYTLLLFMLGYMMGSFSQTLNGYGGLVMIFFLSIIFFITFILGFQMIGASILFLFNESYLPFFLIKIIGLCTILFAISTLVTSHLEVRKS